MIHRACYHHQPVRSAFGVHSFSHHENEKNKRASERSPLLHHHHHHLGIGSIRAILVPASSLSLSTPHLHTLCLYSLRHKTHRHTHLTLLCSLQLLNYGAVVVLLVGNMIEREREKKKNEKNLLLLACVSRRYGLPTAARTCCVS